MREITSFSAAFHRIRRNRHLNVSEVAARTGYSASYVSKLLHGHRALLPDVVRQLDEALGAAGELVRIAAEAHDGPDHWVRPAQLPSTVPDFIGRGSFLRTLDGLASLRHDRDSPRTAVIEGGFWVGKTALAVRWAHQAQADFPGGCLFADLHGFAAGPPADPGQIVNGFLRALGAGGEAFAGTVDERAAHYRSHLAERPAIVILDNAADYDQIRPLLPGGNSVALVTSREHQTDLLARSGGLHLELPPLTKDEALGLLRKRLGEARVAADLPAAESIVRRAGRLPMAVLIAAEHAAHRGVSLERVAAQLRSAHERLEMFTSPDPAVNIYGVIDASYLALPSQPARVFRLLGASPASPISAASTAALADIPPVAAHAALDVLRRAHLIEPAAGTRMRMNHLLRAYAYERAAADEHPRELERVWQRLRQWYATTAASASNALAPGWAGPGLLPPGAADSTVAGFADGDYDGAMAWFEAEASAVLQVARSGPTTELSWQLPATLLPFFYLTKNWSTWLSAAAQAHNAARHTGSRLGTACSVLSLGWVRHEIGHAADAAILLTSALQLHDQLDNDCLAGWTAVALAAAQTILGQHEDARTLYLRADALFTSAGLTLGTAVVRAMLAGTQQELGDPQAPATAHDALALAQEVASNPVLSLAHHQLGLVLHAQGSHRRALTHLDSALRLRRTGRERWGEADTLVARAGALHALNEPVAAVDAYRDAASILDTLHDPRAFDVRERLTALRASLGLLGNADAAS